MARMQHTIVLALAPRLRTRLGVSAALVVLALAGGRPLRAQSEESAPSIIAPQSRVELLAEGCKFTEGPAVDAEGNVFFTDQPNDRILKWSVAGKLSEFKKPAGRSNGLFFDQKGNLLACADEKNQLWS
ncbi:MAG: hypothetical protein JW810_00050, partial [Sedimentisphaerales bacterium]|nr:hypothetical protein [Sedimentisphaerales bacterium]